MWRIFGEGDVLIRCSDHNRVGEFGRVWINCKNADDVSANILSLIDLTLIWDRFIRDYIISFRVC